MRTTPRSPLTPSQKLALLESQDHVCPLCGREIYPGDRPRHEHLRALGLGGTNAFANLAMVHGRCADVKTFGPEGDLTKIADAKRIKRKAFGFEVPRRPMPGGRSDNRKRTIGGGVVDRATGLPFPRPHV
ncbi:HNH endonuclease [Methylobacterium sp. WSM2598]|uniref:HNH endonuclease n=1 Tax=Methylobacterium sp. WSM2598 TaxID=398261 RepID=UPI0003770066|nr:HNH endonuclease [Methylobacterium sp. WSM2598]